MEKTKRRIRIIRADITKLAVDVIVNPANVSARCGNGVDRAIFEAAGREELLAERKIKKPLMTRGEVFVTSSYNLEKKGVKYIFHTLSTFWINGKFKEEEILSDCYRNCLLKAHELHCKSIAFPILGSGSFQYPIDTAFRIAHEQCCAYDREYGDMEISLVVYRGISVEYCETYFRDVESFVSDDDVEEGIVKEYLFSDENFGSIVLPDFVKSTEEETSLFKNPRRYIEQAEVDRFESSAAYIQVKELLDKYTDYAQHRLKLFKKTSDMYNQVYISRQTYSDTMSYGKKWMPKKTTLMKLAIGLHLDLYSFDILLERAGMLENKDDITESIIREHILNNDYDIDAIIYEVEEKDPKSEMIKYENKDRNSPKVKKK